MIDPTKITNFNATKHELQELLLFWICAAGKNGKTAARLLDNLLTTIRNKRELPFSAIKKTKNLPSVLRKHGIGCQQTKATAMIQAASADMDLRTCSVEDLEAIHGIGPKTARCFVLHSRENAQVAALDTHILKFLRAKGHDAPISTPSSKKQYQELETAFLTLAKQANKTPASFDLEIWNSYAKL